METIESGWQGTAADEGWIHLGMREQLQSYIMGPTVQNEIADKNFRALVAVIVGSRQILVREMERRGNWVSEFQLANGCQRSSLLAEEELEA